MDFFSPNKVFFYAFIFLQYLYFIIILFIVLYCCISICHIIACKADLDMLLNIVQQQLCPHWKCAIVGPGLMARSLWNTEVILFVIRTK